MKDLKLHPFVKWVGGKTQLLDEIVQHIPDDVEVYVEPFVGGGAVLFDVLEKRPGVQVVIINDKNVNLINAYYSVIYYTDALIGCLVSISHSFAFAEDKAAFYYEQRKQYNEWLSNYAAAYTENGCDINNIKPYSCDVIVPQAARFMFLNKTCFNGLYRVNANGEFNASFNGAKYVSFDYENIRYISYELKNRITIILDGEFNHPTIIELMEKEQRPDRVFVYLDPPYRKLTKKGGEVSSTDDGFIESKQDELKKFCDFLHEKGIKFLESNSDPEDSYFDKLYEGYNIKRIQARRNINSDGTKRGKINEILISNFDIQ